MVYIFLMSRTRSRSIAANRGTYQSYRGSTWYIDEIGVGHEAKNEIFTDQDNGDFLTPNVAVKDDIVRVGGIANGYMIQETPGSPPRVWSAVNFRLTGIGRSPPNYSSTNPFPTLSEMATEAAGQTSPFRAHVPLPVSIGELRELPNMIREYIPLFVKNQGALGSRTSQYGHHYSDYLRGRHRRTRGQSPWKNGKPKPGNSIAAWEFGFLPLIRDIVDLFSLPKYVDDRVDRIRANAGELVEHRTIHKSKLEANGVQNYAFCSLSGMNVRTNATLISNNEARGTVKWTPRGSAYTTSDPNLRDHVFDRALGLSPMQLVTNAWELLPWSWLADWFGNTGDFLKFASATLDYKVDITISTKRRATEYHKVISSPAWATCADGEIYREAWRRYVNVVPLWAPIRPSPPILSAKQLLILSGIAGNLRSGYKGLTAPVL